MSDRDCPDGTLYRATIAMTMSQLTSPSHIFLWNSKERGRKIQGQWFLQPSFKPYLRLYLYKGQFYVTDHIPAFENARVCVCVCVWIKARTSTWIFGALFSLFSSIGSLFLLCSGFVSILKQSKEHVINMSRLKCVVGFDSRYQTQQCRLVLKYDAWRFVTSVRTPWDQ